jgi:hypothetical protein
MCEGCRKQENTGSAFQKLHLGEIHLKIIPFEPRLLGGKGKIAFFSPHTNVLKNFTEWKRPWFSRGKMLERSDYWSGSWMEKHNWQQQKGVEREPQGKKMAWAQTQRPKMTPAYWNTMNTSITTVFSWRKKMLKDQDLQEAGIHFIQQET